LIIRGVHSPSITSGVITWKALNDNTLPGWLNWPNTGTDDLPYISSQRKLNFSSSNGIFSSETAPAIPSGSGVVVGTFRIYTTTSWTPDSDFGFVWEMTSGGIIGYVNGASSVTNIQHYVAPSSPSSCSSCLTVTASSAQPLNTIAPLSAVLSGDATICETASTNLSVVVSGGQAPYTVTVTDGTNNYTATGTSPLSISVSPSATSTYSISSITGGITGTGTVTITVMPNSTNTAVASACDSYPWNGTTYSASGVYTGATTNCVTQALNLIIVPSTSVYTTITATDTYTWAVNGLTYTTSGVFTGPTVNCVTEYLDLTINSSGISEEEMLLFSLFPNPVSEFLTINFNGESNEEYSIIDNFGSVVKRGVLENMSTEISVSELSAGLYYFKIEGTKPRKFSKIN
jgi:hypothetical protein